jgi:hypothetical protein
MPNVPNAATRAQDAERSRRARIAHFWDEELKYSLALRGQGKNSKDLLFKFPNPISDAEGKESKYFTLEQLWVLSSRVVREEDGVSLTEDAWKVITNRAKVGIKYLQAVGALYYEDGHYAIYSGAEGKSAIKDLDAKDEGYAFVHSNSFLGKEGTEHRFLEQQELMPYVKFEFSNLSADIGWHLKLNPYPGSFGFASWDDLDGIAELYNRSGNQRALEVTASLTNVNFTAQLRKDAKIEARWAKALEDTSKGIFDREIIAPAVRELGTWARQYAYKVEDDPVTFAGSHAYMEEAFLQRIGASGGTGDKHLECFAFEISMQTYTDSDEGRKLSRDLKRMFSTSLGAKLFRLFIKRPTVLTGDEVWARFRSEIQTLGLALIDLEPENEKNYSFARRKESEKYKDYNGLIVKYESLYNENKAIYEFNRNKGRGWNYWKEKL